MAERESDLNRTSDRIPSATLLGERLGLSFQARKDFTNAFQVANSLTDGTPSRVMALVYVGRAQVRSGIDPSPILTGLAQLTEEPGQTHHSFIHKGIAQVHIEAGDFESAQDVLNREPYMPSDRGFYIELARAKARHGQDPSSELSRVCFMIEKYGVSIQSISFYSELAEAHYQTTGEYPEKYFSKAEAIIEAHAGGNPEKRLLPGGHLSKAYATVGNFERAQALVDRIKEDNSLFEARTKMRVLQHIAQEQVSRGLYQDGIANARLAIQIIEHAEVEEVLKLPLKHMQTVNVSKVLAFIGKAQGLAGEDSSETLATALERVDQITHDGYSRKGVLVEIAKAQKAIGIDTVPTFARALTELDAMPQDLGYDGIDMIQQMFGYKELAKIQVEFGQIDNAKITLNRLENFNPVFDSSAMKDTVAEEVVEVLADIAEAEARKGLSFNEIKALSKDEIQTILQGSNEQARQAIAALGLAT